MSFDGIYDFDYNYPLDNGYNLDSFRLGLLHSHCQTAVFFSGPDTQELKENAANHPFYVSLITNNRNEWCGKICIEEKREVRESGKVSYRSTTGDIVSKSINETKVIKDYIIFDCDIYYNTPDVNADFRDRVQEIIDSRPKAVVKKYNPQVYDYNQLYQDAFDDKFTDTWDEQIDWFFNVANNTLEELAVSGDYEESTFGPEALMVFIDACQIHLLKGQEKELINAVLKRLEHYSTPFAKQLKKDYERYTKKVTK